MPLFSGGACVRAWRREERAGGSEGSEGTAACEGEGGAHAGRGGAWLHEGGASPEECIA